ncbi:hypothetical protein ACOME3_005734 [Neoechinorhynchus agilis]
MTSSKTYSPFLRCGQVSDSYVPFCTSLTISKSELQVFTVAGGSILKFRGNDIAYVGQSESLIDFQNERINCLCSGNGWIFVAIRNVITIIDTKSFQENYEKLKIDEEVADMYMFDSFHVVIVDYRSQVHIWAFKENVIDVSLSLLNQELNSRPFIVHPATYLNKVLIVQGRNAQLVNVKHGRIIYEFKFNSQIHCVVQSTVVDIVAIGFDNGDCVVYDLAQDKQILRFQHEHGPVLAASFRLDRKRDQLVTGGNGFIACWDLNERQHIHQLLEFLSTIPVILVASDDNALRQFVVDDNNNRLRLLRERKGNPSFVQQIRFIQDDTSRVLVASGQKLLSYNLSMYRPFGNELHLKPHLLPSPILDVCVQEQKENFFENVICLHRHQSGVSTACSGTRNWDYNGILKPLKSKKHKEQVAKCADISCCGNFAIVGYDNIDPLVVVAVFNLEVQELRNMYYFKVCSDERIISVHLTQLNRELLLSTNVSVLKQNLVDEASAILELKNEKPTVLKISNGVTGKTHLLRQRAILAVPSKNTLVLVDCNKMTVIRLLETKIGLIWDFLTGHLIDSLQFDSPVVSMDVDSNDLLAISRQNSQLIEVFVRTFSDQICLTTNLVPKITNDEILLSPYGSRTLRSLIHADVIQTKCRPAEPTIKRPTEIPFFLSNTSDIDKQPKHENTKKRKKSELLHTYSLNEPSTLMRNLESSTAVQIVEEVDMLDFDEIGALVRAMEHKLIQTEHFELCSGLVTVLTRHLVKNGDDEIRSVYLPKLEQIANELHRSFNDIRQYACSCYSIISFLRIDFFQTKMSVMSFFGLGGSSVNVTFDLNDNANRLKRMVKDSEQVERSLPVYYDGDDVIGRVSLSLRKQGSRLEHQGIRVEFIGQVELNPDKNIVLASSSGGSSVHEFVSMSKLLAYPGELSQDNTFDFAFANVDKPFESYYGTNVRLRYFIRLSVQKRFSSTIVEEDVYVESLKKTETNELSPIMKPINMEVGIEDCLRVVRKEGDFSAFRPYRLCHNFVSFEPVHIEFEYDKSRYHLKDVIVGKIFFSLVRIKVKYMEISLVRKETVGTGPGAYGETEVMAHHEILDGAPSKGETIPIRMFLGAYDLLTPTMCNVRDKFSVQYYLNLVLVDEDDRRYFKQQEIVLWRKSPGSDFLHRKEIIHTLPRMEPVVQSKVVETALVEG